MPYVVSPTEIAAPQLAGVSGAVATLRTELAVSWAMSWKAPVVPSGPLDWYQAVAIDFRSTPALLVQPPAPGAAFCHSRPGALELLEPTLVPQYSAPANVSKSQATLPAPRSRSCTGVPVPPGIW